MNKQVYSHGLSAYDDRDGSISNNIELVVEKSDEFKLEEGVYVNGKTLIKIVDVLGRNIQEKQKNQMIFYIYSDGSVEKKYIK